MNVTIKIIEELDLQGRILIQQGHSLKNRASALRKALSARGTTDNALKKLNAEQISKIKADLEKSRMR